MIVFTRTSANVVHCITCTLYKIVHRQNKKMATIFANNSATLMHPNQSISLHARYGYLRPSLRHSNTERRKSLGKKNVCQIPTVSRPTNAFSFNQFILSLSRYYVPTNSVATTLCTQTTQPLWRRARAQNVTIWMFLRWPVKTINSVDKTNFPCYSSNSFYFHQLPVKNQVWLQIITFFNGNFTPISEILVHCIIEFKNSNSRALYKEILQDLQNIISFRTAKKYYDNAT